MRRFIYQRHSDEHHGPYPPYEGILFSDGYMLMREANPLLPGSGYFEVFGSYEDFDEKWGAGFDGTLKWIDDEPA